MSEQLSTGVDALDRTLRGGVPAGSVVAVTAKPASRADRLLYELASARRTLYLTATRSAAAVRDALARDGVDADRCAVHDLDAERPLDHAYQLVQQTTEPATVVIDPANALERANEGRLADFLNALRGHLTETGGVAVLHCLDGRSVPPQRDVTEYVADGVLSVATERRDGELETRLAVPKFRGKPPATESIELAFDRGGRVEGPVS
ncbi:transcriptional regulator [Halostella sp. JP-L12]|uniref:RAD55 family ATPase n=1 Tax=Halostella TaxID=1843185 RepID=UPI000EF7BB2C|nr:MULTISPECIES: ATPase domain-containing protein [Halostella]NHN46617.1 transcriptional regulator [Halostella sp. JP-L12]